MSGAPDVTSQFEHDQFERVYPAGAEHHFWAKARIAILVRALHEAERNGLRTPHGRILEIGCATGTVVGGLRSAGFDIWGVEVGHPKPLAGLEDRLIVGTRAQDLDPEFRNGIETLMLLDVIEHIDDDESFLAEILPHFPKCRCIVITVPARAEVWSEWDDYYRHYRRYSPESLGQVLRKVGLKPTIRYFFRSLYLVARLQSLMKIERSVDLRPPKLTSLHSLAARLLVLEDKILPNAQVPGLSLIALSPVDSSRHGRN